MRGKWEPREPIAKLGDIVQIRGYGERKFEIFTLSYSMDMDAVDLFEDIYYDVAALDVPEYLLACQEDIIVVETPNEVDYDTLEEHSVQNNIETYSYLSSIGLQGYEMVTGDTDEVDDDNTEEGEIVPKQRKEDEKESDKVDELLTELSDYYTLVGLVGEDYEDGDGYYKRKIDDVKAELAELTGGKAE